MSASRSLHCSSSESIQAGGGEREREEERDESRAIRETSISLSLFKVEKKKKGKPLTRIRWRKKREETIPWMESPLQRVKYNGDVRGTRVEEDRDSEWNGRKLDKFDRNFFQSSKVAGYTLAILSTRGHGARTLERRLRKARQSPRLSSRGVIKVRFPWDRVFSRDFRGNGRENCRRKKAYPLALRRGRGTRPSLPVETTLKDRTHSSFFPPPSLSRKLVRTALDPLPSTRSGFDRVVIRCALASLR